MASMTGRRGRAASVFSFPNPVDEVSARLVAGGVVVLSALALVTGWSWLVGLIALGFIARVLSGPTLSPLGQLMTRVVRPRLRVAPRYVAGPPKRFAQAIGAVFTTSAAVLALGFDQQLVVQLLLACMIVAATLESVFAICLGCKAFAVLMRVGLVPDEVCERCNNLRG
jgi:hypothetical protein